MQERDRTRRTSLQGLLGDLGTVLPYARANTRTPALGWYLAITDVQLSSVLAARPDMWFTGDGSLYAGIDTIHAAMTIERINALAESQRG